MAELMIALGILGIGIPMIFSLFAAAVVETKSSFADVLGDIICENGLVVAKASLTLSDMSGVGSMITERTDRLGEKDTRYPVGSEEATTRWGYAVFARKAGEGNDYQLIVLSYRTSNDTDRRLGTLDLNNKICTVVNDQAEGPSKLRVASDEVGKLRVGSPVLFRRTGRYARIVTINESDNSCRLDRRLAPSDTGPVYVFAEQRRSGGNWGIVSKSEEPTSPVLSVLSVRTAIREQ